jgi:Zn-dependent M28 family amino/carboxypeptidase
VASLDVDQLKDLALYLNFDMIASPNPGYFTIDGDQSEAPDPNMEAPRIPEGSAGIERTLVAYLKSAGKSPEDIQFEGRSDFSSFTLAGVAAGGLFTGAEEEMTPEQAERWGGEAGEPFDPNYHKAGDTIDNVDQTALEINGRGAAYAVALYAQDQSGRNGVPIRDDRTRHVLES